MLYTLRKIQPQSRIGRIRDKGVSKNGIVINPLPDDKILDWSKLQQIADDILNSFKMESKYHMG